MGGGRVYNNGISKQLAERRNLAMSNEFHNQFESVYVYLGQVVDLYLCLDTVATWGIEVNGEFVGLYRANQLAQKHIDYT